LVLGLVVFGVGEGITGFSLSLTLSVSLSAISVVLLFECSS